MPDEYDICGATDTSSGDPCQRAAGWGTDYDYGACDTHREGRPSKFTQDRRAQAIERAKLGATLDGCARAAGVTYRTLRNWLDRGEESGEPGDPYFQFFQAFTRARATGENELIERVIEQDPKFLLERSYEYTKTDKHELEHSGTVGTELSLSDEDAAALDAVFGSDE